MKKRQARLRNLEDVPVKVLSLEFVAEECGKIARQELRPQSRVGTDAVRFSEGVMERGVEWAGGDQGRKLRHGRVEPKLARYINRRINVRRLERDSHLDRMGVLRVARRDGADSGRERFHGAERGVIR